MVFAINPTLGQTYEAFRATAMGKNASAIGEPGPLPNASVKPTKSTPIQKITAAIAGVILLIQVSL